MAKFDKDVEVENRVPTGSMADIAFLLLISFMVTTIFRIEEGLEVTLPEARAKKPLDRTHLAHIWIDRTGRISIDDALVPVASIEPVIVKKVQEDNLLIVAFNTDRDVPYRLMHDVMEQLKAASATNVSFNHDSRSAGGS